MQDAVGELLNALEQISPLPEDELLTEELLMEYERVIRGLECYADLRAIIPLLRSFGYGMGFGLYWSVLHLLERFPQEQIIPRIIDAVAQGQPGTSMWGAFMLGRSRDRRAVPTLLPLLSHPLPLVRHNAVVALMMIGDPEAQAHLGNLLEDTDPEVRHQAREALASLREGL